MRWNPGCARVEASLLDGPQVAVVPITILLLRGLILLRIGKHVGVRLWRHLTVYAGRPLRRCFDAAAQKYRGRHCGEGQETGNLVHVGNHLNVLPG